MIADETGDVHRRDAKSAELWGGFKFSAAKLQNTQYSKSLGALGASAVNLSALSV